MKKIIKQAIGTKKQIKQLQKEVEQRFGQKIESKNSSIALYEAILSETGAFLSYNTIRRFFGLVESKSQIRLSSLNILAAYCGYATFDVFANQKTDIDKQELKFKRLKFLKPENFDIDTIISLCKKYYGFLEIYLFLEQCLIIAHYQNNIAFFKKFYKIPYIFSLKAFNRTALFDIANLYAHLIDNYDENVKREILSEIGVQPNARRFYFEWYVDLNNINNSYGEALEQYIKNNQKQDALVFYHELKVFQAFLNKDKNRIKIHFEELIKHYPKNDSKAHPFLAGRYFASKIFVFSKLSQNEMGIIDKKIIEIAEKSILNAQFFLIPIFQALQYSNNNSQMSILLKKHHKYFVLHDLLSDNSVNHINIYLAQSALYDGRTELAENY
ncbi:MAG: hypothetical protein R6U85_09660, partial [Salinivirgaceae bacterium]